MRAIPVSFLFIGLFVNATYGQATDSLRLYGDVRVTIDRPVEMRRNAPTLLIIYALPNGNTTEQTKGKRMLPGDDWHFDIQHIGAQTRFVREKLNENIIVAYLENSYRSWPAWKGKHPLYATEIPAIVDSLQRLTQAGTVYLNGHSGGGSFIFGYLDGSKSIPDQIRRISFIDSDYGYDSSYALKFKKWLHRNKANTLTVFAYNDSVALYNGKPVVSAKGGTWYRSHLMLHHLASFLEFRPSGNDSLLTYKSKKGQVVFIFKTNPDRKIFHTQQVEFNGFIHSILYRTGKESEGYEYYGQRAYTRFIE